MSAQPRFDVYEVFVQTSHQSEHQHVGSLLAASGDMALLLARENFLRREPAISIWVVPKAAIGGLSAAEDPDFFALEAVDRRYRQASGYPENARRWRKYRRRALTLEELVKD